MGMFEEEEKKMADEAAAANQREEQHRAELDEVAHHIGDDLLSYLRTRRGPHTIDVSVDENIVSLRKRTTSHTLDIKRSGGNLFVIDIDQHAATAVDKSNMIRGVIQWLNH